MATDLRGVVTKALVGAIIVVAAHKLGLKLDDVDLTPLVDACVGTLFGWLALRRPGDVRAPSK